MSTTLFRRTLAATGVLAVCLAFDQTAEAADGFYEPFTTLDTSRWYVSDGWTNGSHQGCTWDAGKLRVADGVLELAIGPRDVSGGEARDEDRPALACAELQTRARFGYGLYEVSMRTARGSGIITAFFGYTGPVHDNPHDEIDVELPGRDPTRLETNHFTAGDGGNMRAVALPSRADEDFTHYAYEWTESGIRWFVDGEMVHEVRAADLQPGALPSHRQGIYLSLWNGTQKSADWLGSLDPSILPVRAAVDWVGFTPAGERCLFPRSMSCRDDWGTDGRS